MASPRLELYPRGLPLAEALRISQAGAGVRRDHGITVGDLLARVQARFPDLEAYRPPPTYVVMEEALKEAGFPLDYDTDGQHFRPPAVTTSWRSSTGTATGLLGAVPAVPGARTPVDLVAAKLTAAIRQGGFLALTIHLRYLADAPQLLADAYPVVPVDVAALFLEEFRALATEQDTDWAKVLKADEKLTRTGEMPAGLRSYVTWVMARLEERLLSAAAPARTVLFLHDAGVLGRYFDQGGHDLLARLQNAARRPADAPHGLWLLCPSEAPKATPNLDGRTVEAIGGEAEWAVLGKSFLTSRASASEIGRVLRPSSASRQCGHRGLWSSRSVMSRMAHDNIATALRHPRWHQPLPARRPHPPPAPDLKQVLPAPTHRSHRRSDRAPGVVTADHVRALFDRTYCDRCLIVL